MTRPGPLRLYAYQRTFFDEDPSLPGRCFEQVQKAYALDDGESEVHRALAAFHLVWQDFDKAAAHLERALDLNPNDDRIVCQRGELATCLGRPGEGRAVGASRHALEPLLLAALLASARPGPLPPGPLCRSSGCAPARADARPPCPDVLAAILARLGRADGARGSSASSGRARQRSHRRRPHAAAAVPAAPGSRRRGGGLAARRAAGLTGQDS